MRDLFAAQTLVAVREHPQLARTLRRLAAQQEIQTVLPGIFALPDAREFLDVRVRALRMSDPDAVLVGRAAATMSYWPELPVRTLHAVTKHRRVAYRGYEFSRRALPAEVVTEIKGVRMTTPALTALDLCLELAGDGIDEALRRGAATLDDLHEALALVPHQPGNDCRRRYLQESSAEPWSAAERLLHRLLREAGIGGWRGNVEVVIGGLTYVVDVLFRRERVAVEVDGRWYHGEARFELDRRRQNLLVLDGWLVLRFTWKMLDDEPDWVIARIDEALRTRSPWRSAG